MHSIDSCNTRVLLNTARESSLVSIVGTLSQAAATWLHRLRLGRGDMLQVIRITRHGILVSPALGLQLLLPNHLASQIQIGERATGVCATRVSVLSLKDRAAGV